MQGFYLNQKNSKIQKKLHEKKKISMMNSVVHFAFNHEWKRFFFTAIDFNTFIIKQNYTKTNFELRFIWLFLNWNRKKIIESEKPAIDAPACCSFHLCSVSLIALKQRNMQMFSFKTQISETLSRMKFWWHNPFLNSFFFSLFFFFFIVITFGCIFLCHLTNLQLVC